MRMNRAAYVEALKVQLREWDDRIDMLATLARLADLDVQSDLQARMVRVLNKRDELRDKVQQLEVTSEDAWEAVKDSVDETHSELRATFDETKACLTV
jgi:uncharacterized coiled-coil DUF342 family protein